MKTTQNRVSTTPKLLLCALALGWAAVSASAVDPVIPFAGKLANQQGVPLNGEFLVTFRIYTEPAGGTPVWTEVHNAATVTKGVLTVNLGSVSGFGALELIEGFWLGITVGSDAEMTPRVQVPAQTVVPAGTIAPFGGEAANVPNGWLLCDGKELSVEAHPRLYQAVGKAWGSPSASTFNVPDLRGYFLRGVDSTQSANRDPDGAGRTRLNPGGATGRNVGSYQQDELKSHTHTQTGGPTTQILANGSHIGIPHNTSSPTGATGGSETRPKNAYVNYIIKS